MENRIQPLLIIGVTLVVEEEKKYFKMKIYESQVSRMNQFLDIVNQYCPELKREYELDIHGLPENLNYFLKKLWWRIFSKAHAVLPTGRDVKFQIQINEIAEKLFNYDWVDITINVFDSTYLQKTSSIAQHYEKLSKRQVLIIKKY